MGQLSSHSVDTNKHQNNTTSTDEWKWSSDGDNNWKDCDAHINNILNNNLLVGQIKTIIVDNESNIFSKFDEMNALQKNIETNTIKTIQRKTTNVKISHKIEEKSNTSFQKVKIRYLHLLRGYIRDIYHKLSGNNIIPLEILKLCGVYYTEEISTHHLQFGLKYFYWDYYKYNICTQDPTDKFYGTTRCIKHQNRVLTDFYVPKKYANLKIELCENHICHISMYQWNNLFSKASVIGNFAHAKSLFCPRQQSATYYSMEYGQLISISHLISMMIMCNFVMLYEKFQETFRFRDNITTVEEMIEQHREYYWLARYVTECIECFGMKWETSQSDIIRLYYGTDKYLTPCSLNTFVCAPFEASYTYEVAVNFCGNKGMLLELEINVNNWRMKLNEGINAYKRLCCFDTAWLSDYSWESMIFFIGGMNSIWLNSIIDVVAFIDYSFYVKGLRQMTYYMNCGGNAFDLNMFATRKVEQQMVFRLLSFAIWKSDPNHENAHNFKNCPEYVKTVLDNHCKSIKNIYFDSKKQDKVCNSMLKYDNGWIKLNLLLKIFPNAKHVAVDFTNKELLFLKDDIIYNHIIKFISENHSSLMKLRTIQIQIKPVFLKEMKCYMEKFYSKLKLYDWMVEINIIENINKGLFGLEKVKKQVTIMIVNKYYIGHVPIQITTDKSKVQP